MELKLMEKMEEAKNVYSFVFEPENPVSWKAGQFIFYKIPHEHPDNRGIERHFTISSASYEKNIMLTSKFDPENGSSFKKALLKKEPGDTIEAYDIKGKFTMDPNMSYSVFIAGGIGITPYRSILLDLEKNNSIPNIVLLYSCRDRESLVYKDLWDKLEKNNNGLRTSFIFEPQFVDEGLLKKEVPDMDRRMFYVSGPVKMVQAIEKGLSQLSIDQSKIIKDYFPGYA